MIKGTCKTIAKLLLLVPILILMLGVNFHVDMTGLFQGDQFERELAAKLLDGKAISHFEKLDERQILRLYIQNMPEKYNTMVVGSSRGLQITAAIAGEEGSFYNAGMTGEDRHDIFGTIALLDKYDRLPNNLILVLDPWVLCSGVDATNPKSDVNLANRFLSEVLGFDVPYTQENTAQYTAALFSPDYFQNNVAYYFSDHTGEEQPAEVTGNIYKQDTEIKMADGTLLYTEEYRTQSQQAVDNDAYLRANMNFMMCGDNFSQPDKTLCAQFTAMIDYLQDKGVNVSFVLSPFHPYYYARVATHMETEGGVIGSEEFFEQLAREKEIPIYGSYDALSIGCDETDFYDGLHVRRESVRKFFYGINSGLV